MKNAEQFRTDMKADEALRAKFREGINKLRGDKTLSMAEAGQRVARELGYEISDEEAKKFTTQRASKAKLSDSELDNAAGGRDCGGSCSGAGGGSSCLCEW